MVVTEAGQQAPPHRYALPFLLVPAGLLLTIVGLVVSEPLGMVGGLVCVVGILAFLMVPSPIRPVAWTPGAAPPMIGVLAGRRGLAQADVLASGQIHGPEDLAISPDGRTLCASGYRDGRILRIEVGEGMGDRVVEQAVTGGSPSDLALRADGSLLVCDWAKGLLLVSGSGEVETLLPLGMIVDGRPFVRPDGVSEAAGGTLYISEGSSRPGI